MPERVEAGAADGIRQGPPGGAEDAGHSAGENREHGTGDGRGDREPIDLYRLCYELAGIIGVHPGEWTLRGLAWAAKGKQKEAWDHTSSLVAQQYSIHRDPKKRREPYQPRDFHPFYEPPKVQPKVITPEIFKELFGE